MMNKGVLAAVVSASIAACAADPVELTSSQAIEMANEFLEGELPYDLNALEPTVTDEGDQWKIEYDLRPGYMGGTPRVLVDKKTGHISILELSQ